MTPCFVITHTFEESSVSIFMLAFILNPEDGDRRFLWKPGNHQLDYTVSRPWEGHSINFPYFVYYPPFSITIFVCSGTADHMWKPFKVNLLEYLTPCQVQFIWNLMLSTPVLRFKMHWTSSCCVHQSLLCCYDLVLLFFSHKGLTHLLWWKVAIFNQFWCWKV
jgi:hypothetical protein